ncbi:MAG: aminoacetone oxidase family FAD-binding enzyme [Bacteroidales bacterium]|nr:aminoacetone oxidase family FAD-binding enzyme [Bacteroidales bacterium]
MKGRIVVIGGGAAGLMAAAGAGYWIDTHPEAFVERPEIFVLEKMPRPGRKIMITGKGRCNFTNMKQWQEFSAHVHPKANVLKPAFYNLNPEAMMDFLQNQGLDCVVERGDRAYPASHVASDVVDALVRAAERAGAKIITDAPVNQLSLKEDSRFLVNYSRGRSMVADKVIVATGGLSYPRTGSTGDGYVFAQQLGIRLTPTFPSLTAIVPKGYKNLSEDWTPQMKGHVDRSEPLSETGEQLCGLELDNVAMSLMIDGSESAAEFGDISFTDGGLEGPVGFRLSRKVVNAVINGSKVAVCIDLKPAVELEELNARVQKLWDEVCKDRRSQGKTYREKFRVLLSKLIPAQLVPMFMNYPVTLDHKSLPAALKGWKLPVEGYVGYERCVITAGGVDMAEVTPKTLETRQVKGLYFAGELLDLDADTGGYNLQTAFSTGYLAGQSAARSLSRL